MKINHTPISTNSGCNVFGVGEGWTGVPRVALVAQPWAAGRNTFGIFYRAAGRGSPSSDLEFQISTPSSDLRPPTSDFRPRTSGQTSDLRPPSSDLASCVAGFLPGRWLAGGVALAVFASVAAWGQEAVRMSQAGDQAAEARSEAARRLGNENLRLGLTRWSFSAGTGVEVNDNLRLTATDTQQDVILRPEVRARMRWPVSEMNSLNLALGAGYLFYLQHADYSRPFITPGTDVAFDLYVGDFRIDLHDRVSLSSANYEDPNLTGKGDYQALENALGVGAVWDLNKVVVKAGFDHLNYMSLGSSIRVPDRVTESFYTSVGYSIKSDMVVGLDLGGALVDYSPVTGSYAAAAGTQWNAGPFFETRLSRHVRFRSKVGYTGFNLDTSSVPPRSDSFTGPYFQMEVTHALNQYFDHGLSCGRNQYLAYSGTMVDTYYARWQANWKLIRETRISTSFSYLQGTAGFAGSETYDRYGPGVSLSRDFLKNKLSSSLRWQYYWRESDLAGRDYKVNIVSLNLMYNF